MSKTRRKKQNSTLRHSCYNHAKCDMYRNVYKKIMFVRAYCKCLRIIQYICAYRMC